MFLCDNCHDASKHFDFFRSRGRCEGCGKTANCIDCHFSQCDKPKADIKVDFGNLERLAETLRLLAQTPQPLNRAWKTRLRLTLESVAEYHPNWPDLTPKET